jgi:peptide-methionine (R)-S-oxide reductase
MTRYNEIMRNDKGLKLDNLTPEEYHTTQEKGTDAPFMGRYVHNEKSGSYHCVVCGNLLFDSDTKFDSGSGWPSFYDLASKKAVEIKPDSSHNMNRDEVVCAECGAHLGHLFLDGPKQTTGLRYCINSSGLNFNSEK